MESRRKWKTFSQKSNLSLGLRTFSESKENAEQFFLALKLILCNFLDRNRKRIVKV